MNVSLAKFSNIAQMPISFSVPFRHGENAMVLTNIDSVDTWLKYHAGRSDNVLPTSFKKNIVHVNGKGLEYYARRVVGHSQNFHRPSQQRDR